MSQGSVCPRASLPRVVVIGGGFSGTMVAVHLAARGITTTVIDRAERPARGLAYSTCLPDHLLNVRASNMSAFPDRPTDFVDRIAQYGGTPDTFARRSDYGDYLAGIFSKVVDAGLVRRVAGTATRASKNGESWNIHLDGGTVVTGRTLVLATGNGAPAPLGALREIGPDDLVDELWSQGGKARLERAAERAEPLLIVGAGLTMVDAVLSLDEAGHRGQLTAVSRRGLLPRPHAARRTCDPSPPSLAELPSTVTSLCRWIRERSGQGEDWRAAVDCLRPLTQQIWDRMDPTEKRRFLRHGRIWWDVHRHRLAPQVHERVRRLIDSGRLRVIAGRLTSSRGLDGRYVVSIARRGSDEITEVEAGLVLNCTGPSHGLSDHNEDLISQMHDEGLVRPDALGLGIEIGSDNRVCGAQNAFAIGPITKGRYWEIIAVPDLREKAAEIAATIARDEWAAADGETGLTALAAGKRGPGPGLPSRKTNGN